MVVTDCCTVHSCVCHRGFVMHCCCLDHCRSWPKDIWCDMLYNALHADFPTCVRPTASEPVWQVLQIIEPTQCARVNELCSWPRLGCVGLDCTWWCCFVGWTGCRLAGAVHLPAGTTAGPCNLIKPTVGYALSGSICTLSVDSESYMKPSCKSKELAQTLRVFRNFR